MWARLQRSPNQRQQQQDADDDERGVDDRLETALGRDVATDLRSSVQDESMVRGRNEREEDAGRDRESDRKSDADRKQVDRQEGVTPEKAQPRHDDERNRVDRSALTDRQHIRATEAGIKKTAYGFKLAPLRNPTVASDGNILVLVVLDLLLSLLFASVVLWGLAFMGEASFTARNLAIGTVALAVVTYLVVLRE